MTENLSILIKDKSGRIYKRLSNGMIVRVSLNEIKKFTVSEIESKLSPVPYTNLIKQDELKNNFRLSGEE